MLTLHQIGKLDVGRTIRTTPVFESFWLLACERQRIFYRRLAGQPPPWTDDDVLSSHKFTNAYRASDRVSQYLINNVIPRSESNPTDLFFRIILFKVFNRISTWELLTDALGPIHWSTFDHTRFDGLLTAALDGGERIYSAAYIMPPPQLGETRKHRNHLRLISGMIDQDLPDRIASANSMQEAFTLLRELPSIGSFLAYQYVIDLNYSGLTSFAESEFVAPGPGAKDGIRKCFADTGGLEDADVIKLTAEISETCLDRMGLEFPALWGRPLQLIDYQNLFCEVGKYARAVHPEVRGTSTRTRIKQRYTALEAPVTALYPEKWCLPLAQAMVDGTEIPYARAAVGAT